MKPFVPVALLVTFLSTPAAAPEPGPAWDSVAYGSLVDRTQLTHSGEPVGALLDRLGGRPFPAPGERRADLLAYRLLDPWLEPYAFVLADALEATGPAASKPWREIGAAWESGAGAEPAWVELLRARRFFLLGDGAGKIRAFVPWPEGEGPAGAAKPLPDDSAAASRAAWDAAWPVVRHALAAERRRIGEKPLQVEAYAYRHDRARTRFDLAARAWTETVSSTAARSGRPPLDLVAFASVLSRAARIEGARLEPDGTIRWFTSDAVAPPELLGRPLTLGDAAVAYRAVFHGGLAEPYMSLDRGRAPWISAVNYGGRLRDTTLGLVSLLSDVRFKTFSLGVDPVAGRDAREEARAAVPGFATHLERMAADPGSGEVAGQQTRFWFYPDEVDLALSENLDTFAIRRARMAAASERVESAVDLDAAGSERPWTKATTAFLNANRAPLGRLFPEIASLDEVARLLAIFTWLRAAKAEGLVVPDLDLLLDVEIPAEPTARTFPQLLTWNALPPAGGAGAVEVVDQAEVGAALERLLPRAGTELAPALALSRAAAWLDGRIPEDAALLAEIERARNGSAGPEVLENLRFRAQRLAMHRLVLGKVPESPRSRVAARRAAGEPMRVFSVGIGGIDLGMESALARASRRKLGFGDESPARPVAPAATPRVFAGTESPAMRTGVRVPDSAVVRNGTWKGPDGREHAWTLVVQGPWGSEVRSRRRVDDPKGGPAVFERVEGGRFHSYRVERGEAGFAAVPAIAPAPLDASPAARDAGELPAGLALLEILRPADPPSAEPATVSLRVRGPGTRDVAANAPRGALQRLVLGRAMDPAAGKPLSGLESSKGLLAGASTLMVVEDPRAIREPWSGARAAIPGEEDPFVLARAFGSYWGDAPVVVGLEAARSPERWVRAKPAAGTRVVVAAEAFPGARRDLAAIARGVFGARATDAADGSEGTLVVVSAEAPGALAARLREAADAGRLAGRAVAVVSLGGALRRDVVRALLDPGGAAAVGLFETEPIAVERALRSVAAWVDARDRAPEGARAESVAGPFVWIY
ncbi:MAG TPA: hypothetical protein VF139_02715 [Candidatus Polarisedimenticolaceae bacterium]